MTLFGKNELKCETSKSKKTINKKMSLVKCELKWIIDEKFRF